MSFTIVRQDITNMKVDAIVNAANTRLKMGGGVCGTIFKKAGADTLQAACDRLAPIKTGEAVITPGFSLAAKYIIHTAGPVYDKFHPETSAELLRLAYRSSLKLAAQNRCESIAFPLISSGIYGVPKDKALSAANDAILDFLKYQEMDVYLAVFDKAAFTLSEKLMGEVAAYIDEHYVEQHSMRRRRFLYSNDLSVEADFPQTASFESVNHAATPVPAFSRPSFSKIDDLIGHLDEPFSESLFRLIDLKRKTDVEVYKKANLDRKLFSKIKSGKGYRPGKRTVLALAIALELSSEETSGLLNCAGYALSRSQVFDVIVDYFIVSGQYNIFEINEVLFKYDQPLLGG